MYMVSLERMVLSALELDQTLIQICLRQGQDALGKKAAK